MLHHIPVVAPMGLPLLIFCCCGWVPRPGDDSLTEHLRAAARIGKMTVANYEAKLCHFEIELPGKRHALTMHPDNHMIMEAARSGDWPTVVAMLKEVQDHGAARRDS